MPQACRWSSPPGGTSCAVACGGSKTPGDHQNRLPCLCKRAGAIQRIWCFSSALVSWYECADAPFSGHASALCLCWRCRRLDELPCNPNPTRCLTLARPFRLQPEALRQRNLSLSDLQANILFACNFPGASTQACQLRSRILHVYDAMTCIAL